MVSLCLGNCPHFLDFRRSNSVAGRLHAIPDYPFRQRSEVRAVATRKRRKQKVYLPIRAGESSEFVTKSKLKLEFRTSASRSRIIIFSPVFFPSSSPVLPQLSSILFDAMGKGSATQSFENEKAPSDVQLENASEEATMAEPSRTYTAEEEEKLYRRVDWRILPILALLVRLLRVIIFAWI